MPAAAPPHRVVVPVNLHRWHRITFLHYRFRPEVVAALLPTPLQVLTFDGEAWVSVTPFEMHVRLPGRQLAPAWCRFPETNVRTYVRGPDGREGLWFLRLEADAAWFVALLRAMGLPYVRHDMAVTVADEHVTYRSTAGRTGGGHVIEVRPGRRLDPSHGDARARFVTARWGAYHRRGPLLLYTPVAHPPWELRHGDLRRADVDGLLRSVGLQAPTGRPVVHHSDGVPTRVGPPRVAALVRG